MHIYAFYQSGSWSYFNLEWFLLALKHFSRNAFSSDSIPDMCISNLQCILNVYRKTSFFSSFSVIHPPTTIYIYNWHLVNTKDVNTMIKTSYTQHYNKKSSRELFFTQMNYIFFIILNKIIFALLYIFNLTRTRSHTLKYSTYYIFTDIHILYSSIILLKKSP